MPTHLLTFRENRQELRRHDQDGVHSTIPEAGNMMSFETEPTTLERFADGLENLLNHGSNRNFSSAAQ